MATPKSGSGAAATPPVAGYTKTTSSRVALAIAPATPKTRVRPTTPRSPTAAAATVKVKPIPVAKKGSGQKALPHGPATRGRTPAATAHNKHVAHVAHVKHMAHEARVARRAGHVKTED